MGLFTKKTQSEQQEYKFNLAAADFWGVAGPSIGASMTHSSALASAVNWLQINISEPDLKQVTEQDGQKVYVDELPVWLTNQPQGHNLSLKDKIAAIASDLVIHGNACLIKLRNSRRQHIATQYIPWTSVSVELAADKTKIEYYKIYGNIYSINDVIHFRKGTDPQNPFLGFSVWENLQLHNSADYFASVYTSALVASPAPSVILTTTNKVDEDGLERVARKWKERVSHTSAGNPIAMTGDWKIEKISYSPDELNINELINYGEERICALMGIPPQVLQLSSGKNPTYSNYEQALYSVTTNLLVPIWTIIADTISQNAEDQTMFEFNFEEVQSLQKDQNAESERVANLFKNKLIDRATAKKMLGIESVAEDEGKYYE